MRPHDGMARRELKVDVQWRAARGHDCVPSFLTGGFEDGLGAGGGQRLEELLVRAGDAVVDLVSRCPESVASRGGSGLHAQEREVGGAVFEEGVAVPLAGEVGGFVGGRAVFHGCVELLLGFGVYYVAKRVRMESEG